MDVLLIILIFLVLILNIVFFIKFKKEPKNNETELDADTRSSVSAFAQVDKRKIS